VLLVSGLAKIIDPSGMLNILQSAFPFFNQDIIILTATLVPAIEIVLGLMLLLNSKKNIALVLTSILFGCFFLFAVYGTISGFEEDCGCFGNIVRSSFDTWIVLRNLTFFLIAFILSKRSISI
jgi:hypothetical protein